MKTARRQDLGMNQAGPALDAVSTIDIVVRLKFLRELQGRPAFAGHAVLSAVVGDYARALQKAVAAEDPP